MNPIVEDKTPRRAGEAPTILPSGVMIAVTPQGVMLPEGDGFPARALGLDELELLENLGRAPGSVRLDNGLGEFLDELIARGLLTRASFRPPPEPLDAPVVRSGPCESDSLVLVIPIIFRLGPAGYEQLSHDRGVGVRLSAAELLAASEFRRPIIASEAWARHAASPGHKRIDERSFEVLIRRLLGSGLLRRVDPNDPVQQRALSREERDIRRALVSERTLVSILERRTAEHDAAERTREARTGVRRTPVVPVYLQWQIPPLALGMIVAYAMQHEGGRLCEHYDFRPVWLSDGTGMPPRAQRPSIYLFSHYVWSSARNLAMSERIKAADPGGITIHGGPDVPKYEGDVEAYFREHPHVDVAIHGEGEVATAEVLAALVPALPGDRIELAALEGVPGLSFRRGDRLVRTADRGRIVDLDNLPSPYLTGLFDGFGEAPVENAVLESNRGCPYGCTFCDWGSATLSRIRKFSLDRVFDELTWCAAHGIQIFGIADANFGIFERDVAIAEKVAELRRQYGVPRHIGLNYAKNSLRYLRPIVKILAEADIITYGLVSLQSMDPGTLNTVNRSNIKVEKYHELAHEFRRAGLPLFVDLMMGLPGATVDSFRSDLQRSIDREVIAKIHPTQLLVNSPMNEPDYRRRHGIEATPGSLVTSAASYTREDYDQMRKLRRVFLLLEKFGVLRHVARYVRQEAKVHEIAFYERLWRDTRSARSRWPVTGFTLEAVPELMVPPGRWSLLLDEVRRYVVDVLGVADDDALATVLAVQNALLPARQRQFPQTLSLRHDYAAWHAAMVTAKDDGHLEDWTDVVRPLRQLPAATFTVDDPYDVCLLGIGHTVDSDIWGVWELTSSVSRPVVPLHAASNDLPPRRPSP
jgi:radical SAM superfamily enzyme YgiQ (UPF0313 family)